MVNSNTEIEQLVHMLMHSVVPLVVHKDGIVAYANEAAYRVMRFDPNKSYLGARVSQFVEPSEREESARVMQAILQSPEPARSVVRRCVNGEGKTVRLLCTIMPVQWQGGLAAALTFMSLDDLDARSDKRLRRSRVVETLGLSPREKQVAMFVAQGFSVHNIAALLQIQRETVRTHIKAIYRKTNTHTRVELTRIMLGARTSMPRSEASSLRKRSVARRGSGTRIEP